MREKRLWADKWESLRWELVYLRSLSGVCGYLNTIIHVQDASAFKTGDFAILHFTCGFGWNNGVSIQHWYDAWAENTPQRIVRIDGNYVELQSNAAFTTLDDKYTGCENHYIHDVARFFEAINGGTLHPDYEFTLKPTSGYMLRAYSTSTMKKREPVTY